MVFTQDNITKCLEGNLISQRAKSVSLFSADIVTFCNFCSIVMAERLFFVWKCQKWYLDYLNATHPIISIATAERFSLRLKAPKKRVLIYYRAKSPLELYRRVWNINCMSQSAKSNISIISMLRASLTLSWGLKGRFSVSQGQIYWFITWVKAQLTLLWGT